MSDGPRFRIDVDPEFVKNFDPDQPRDESGKWTSGGSMSAPKTGVEGPKGIKAEVKIKPHSGTKATIKDLEKNLHTVDPAAKVTVDDVLNPSGWDVYGAGLLGSKDYPRPQVVHVEGTVDVDGEKVPYKILIDHGDKPDNSKFSVGADGHTTFQKPGSKGMSSFDRTGIEDSFYLDKKESATEKVRGEIERIKSSVRVSKTMVDVPDTGYRVTPTRLEEMKSILRGKMGYVDLHPYGMGTGTRISARKLTPHDKPGSEKLAKALGQKRVYISTFEYD